MNWSCDLRANGKIWRTAPATRGPLNICKDINSDHEKSEEHGDSDEDVGKYDNSDDDLLMVPPGLQLWDDDLLGVVDTLLTWTSQCFMIQVECECVREVCESV